jgi:hypothetical protein
LNFVENNIHPVKQLIKDIFFLEIWNTAKKQGKKPFTFFWPGSDVNISGMIC